MMPENHDDELMVLNQGGDGTFEASIDSELRKLLEETKDYIHRLVIFCLIALTIIRM